MTGKERVPTLRFPSGPALRSAHLPGHPQDPGEALEKSLSPPGEGIPAGGGGLRYAGELGACWRWLQCEGRWRERPPGLREEADRAGSDSGKKMELGSLEHCGGGTGRKARARSHPEAVGVCGQGAGRENSARPVRCEGETEWVCGQLRGTGRLLPHGAACVFPPQTRSLAPT